MTEVKANNPFGEGYEEAQAGEFVKWEAVGQTFKGVLTDVYEMESQLSGEMQKIYTFLDKDGIEHRIGSRGPRFDQALKNVVKGQNVGFLFAEEVPSKKKGNNPFKLIKIYLGQIDPDYKVAGEQEIPDFTK